MGNNERVWCIADNRSKMKIFKVVNKIVTLGVTTY